MKRNLIILYCAFLFFSNIVFCQNAIKILDNKIKIFLPTDKMAEKGRNKYIKIKIRNTNNDKNIDTNNYKVIILNKYNKEVGYSRIHTGVLICKKISTPKISISTKNNYKILSIPCLLFCENNKEAKYRLDIGIHKYSIRERYYLYVIYKDNETTYYSDTIPLHVFR